MSVLFKDLPTCELPRERLERFGAASLSNEELIAIILGTGTKNTSAKDLANNILAKKKDITLFNTLNLKELNSLKGMGIAKSTNLLAAIELGKRVYENKNINSKLKIRSALDAYNYFANEIKREKQENFMVIYLDNKSNYISHKIIFKGTINTSLIHPREIIKEALLLDSNLLILMHNHPSGETYPSKEDDIATNSIIAASALLGIKIIDHIIVGINDYYSYSENGRIKYEQN